MAFFRINVRCSYWVCVLIATAHLACNSEQALSDANPVESSDARLSGMDAPGQQTPDRGAPFDDAQPSGDMASDGLHDTVVINDDAEPDSPPAVNGCQAAGKTYPAGAQHPTRECLFCSGPPQPYQWKAKDEGTACGSNGSCRQGWCMPETCQRNGNCPPDFLCKLDIPASGPPTRAICKAKEDSIDDYAVVCQGDGDCAEEFGYRCMDDLLSGFKLCSKTCTHNGGCIVGGKGGRTCQPFQLTNNLYRRLCLIPPAGASTPYGGNCKGSDGKANPGTCTTNICIPVTSSTGSGSFWCSRFCRTSGDCNGLTCRPVNVGSQSFKLCGP